MKPEPVEQPTTARTRSETPLHVKAEPTARSEDMSAVSDGTKATPKPEEIVSIFSRVREIQKLTS